MKKWTVDKALKLILRSPADNMVRRPQPFAAPTGSGKRAYPTRLFWLVKDQRDQVTSSYFGKPLPQAMGEFIRAAGKKTTYYACIGECDRLHVLWFGDGRGPWIVPPRDWTIRSRDENIRYFYYPFGFTASTRLLLLMEQYDSAWINKRVSGNTVYSRKEKLSVAEDLGPYKTFLRGLDATRT